VFPVLRAESAEPDRVSLLLEYTDRLIHVEDTVEGHAQLARWCQEHGLPDKAKIHWQEVLLRDSDNGEARAALGIATQEKIAESMETDDEQVPRSRVLQGEVEQTTPGSSAAEQLWAEKPAAPEPIESEPEIPIAATEMGESGREVAQKVSEAPLVAPEPSQAPPQRERGLPMCLWVALVLVAALVGLWLLKALYGSVLAWRRKRRRWAVTLAGVDRMDGHVFERYVAELIRGQGWKKVEVTPGSGDQGVDIIAERNGIKCAIQTKRQSQPVNRRAVSDAVAGMRYYGCKRAMVVTNNRFTKSAKDLARVNACELLDRDDLGRWIASL